VSGSLEEHELGALIDEVMIGFPRVLSFVRVDHLLEGHQGDSDHA
jgi:hypothetical protein